MTEEELEEEFRRAEFELRGLSKRVWMNLYFSDLRIRTRGDVAREFQAKTLWRITNIGPKAIKEIKAWLGEQSIIQPRAPEWIVLYEQHPGTVAEIRVTAPSMGGALQKLVRNERLMSKQILCCAKTQDAATVVECLTLLTSLPSPPVPAPAPPASPPDPPASPH